MTEHAAIMLYKHTILPFLEYAGFMLNACNVEDRRELRKCQNDALRICKKIQLNDRARIEYLHEKCKIVSLEQRRRQQLLMLMYKKSTDYTLHKSSLGILEKAIVLYLKLIVMKVDYIKEVHILLVPNVGQTCPWCYWLTDYICI